MRDQQLDQALIELNRSSTDIEASAVISKDGLLIASQLPQGLDQDRVGAMSAAILSLGERTAAELRRGSLDQVLIKGKDGYAMLAQAGDEAVVSVLARPDAKLGLIFLDVKRAAETVSKLL
jgi:predicted regulator of Ras-like GTPase activity (Roadblock/LC7/MglB family)